MNKAVIAGTRVVTTLVLVGTLSMVGAHSASAHNILEKTSPAAGSTVARLPNTIVLTFDQPGQAGGSVVVVTGPAGNVASGPVELIDSDVRQAVAPGSPPGRYTVDWRVVSADGHPVSGAFSFTATSGTSGTRPTPNPNADLEPAARRGSHVTAWVAGGAIALIAVGLIATVALAKRRRPAQSVDDD